jgi:hypothetical protein
VRQERSLKLWPWLVVLRVLGGCSSSNNTMTGLTPDFSLSVSPQSVFVPIDVGSGNMQLSVVAPKGSSEAVSVSVNGIADGSHFNTQLSVYDE